MKKIFLTMLLVLLSFVMIGGNDDGKFINTNKLQTKQIYRHFGTANFPANYNTSTTIEAYITKDYVTSANKRGLVDYKYLYEIMIVSHSRYNGIPTNTNLYGVRVFYNGNETSWKTFPNGFNVLILQQPTMIYWIEVNDEKPDITIKWAESMYQTLR